MPDQVAELAERGRSLAPDDRSLISEMEAAWEAEIDRRLRNTIAVRSRPSTQTKCLPKLEALRGDHGEVSAAAEADF